MKVVTLKTADGKTRYYLNDDEGTPVQPVMNYLGFKDNTGTARNTLQLQCFLASDI